MKAKDYLKLIATHSCIYYTAATFFILFVYFVLNSDLSDGVQPLALICILPFAIAFASANAIYRHTALKKWMRFLLHMLLTVGGAFVCLYLPNKDPQQDASAAMMLLLIFAVLYLIVMGAVLFVGYRIHRVTRDEGKYTSVYKK